MEAMMKGVSDLNRTEDEAELHDLGIEMKELMRSETDLRMKMMKKMKLWKKDRSDLKELGPLVGADHKLKAQSDSPETDSDEEAGVSRCSTKVEKWQQAFKGTTIIAIIHEDYTILAADTLETNVETGATRHVKKMEKQGSLVFAGGGNQYASEKVIEYLKKNVKEERGKIVQRSTSILGAAEAAFKYATEVLKLKQNSEVDKFTVVIAGYEQCPRGGEKPCVAWANNQMYSCVGAPTGNKLFDDAAFSDKIYCLSGNDKAEEECINCLREGYIQMSAERLSGDKWLQRGITLARKAIAKASEHCEFTGGSVSVARISKDDGRKDLAGFVPVKKLIKKILPKRKDAPPEEEQELKDEKKQKTTDEDKVD